jgi:hypothetical protein
LWAIRVDSHLRPEPKALALTTNAVRNAWMRVGYSSCFDCVEGNKQEAVCDDRARRGDGEHDCGDQSDHPVASSFVDAEIRKRLKQEAERQEEGANNSERGVVRELSRRSFEPRHQRLGMGEQSENECYRTDEVETEANDRDHDQIVPVCDRWLG